MYEQESWAIIGQHNRVAAAATAAGGSVCPVCDTARNPISPTFQQATRSKPTQFLGYFATCPGRCDGPFLLRSYPVRIESFNPYRAVCV
jgi:hypothetical protein